MRSHPIPPPLPLPLAATLRGRLMAAAGAAAALSAALWAPVPARAQDGEWLSYRDAYRAMVVFEKYGQPKQFLQHHYQVSPRDAGATLDGVRLALNGKNTHLALPLDPAGRAVFPLLKAAYDDNAVLVLNRKLAGYLLRPRISIVARADGVYEAADLRAACGQALGYQRSADPSYRGGKCVGVRFSFIRKEDAAVRVRSGGQSAAQGAGHGQDSVALPAADGPAFAGDAGPDFRIVNYRFDQWPAQGQVISPAPPLAITPVYE